MYSWELSLHSLMTSWRRTTETSWWHTTEMSLGVSFETSWRGSVVLTHSWDLATMFLNDLVETSYWDVLATFHQDVVGCFIWDIPASLGWTERRCHDVITTSFCWVVVCNISIFFQFSCVYPSTWKKANIIPIHERWQSMSQQLCSFYQYLGKFLKNQFSIKCIIFLIGKNFSILTNLVIDI